MTDDVIRKSLEVACKANMPDYGKEVANFSWAAAETLLKGFPDGRINIAYEAIDRHLQNGQGKKLALRWISKSGHRTDFTYSDLSEMSNRFANVLRSLGVKKGERVYSLLGRVPQLYITALGTLKAGCVFCPLFSVFGPEPIKSRMQIGNASLLITTKKLYERKVKSLLEYLPGLRNVILIDGTTDNKDALNLNDLMTAATEDFRTEAMLPEDPALLHFTSGTTGKPKGVLHVHEAVIAHHITGRIALDLQPDDIYWCTADPGWVTGTSYGIIAPFTNGITMIIDEADFDASRWYQILEEEKITVWYTAPTAIRMLMKAGTDLIKIHDLSNLRFLASVGEPLNPEAVYWGVEVFGMPFHDNWWQTETGGIMIANYASMNIKPGSMGKPLPGITAGIIEMSNNGAIEISNPMTIGELALKTSWPSMMRAYLGEDERFRKCFSNGWYLSGDLAMRDSDGYFWFVGRSDDVIKSAGHLIGPFEVESALLEHEAVSEVAVIGIPDETVGEKVMAFVALKTGFEPTEEMHLDLIGHGRKRLGPAVAPKEIVFRKNLPKTRSGKIMRRLLKARELGLPEGDISALESDEQ
jgi:acetyl-CoA synthetase